MTNATLDLRPDTPLKTSEVQATSVWNSVWSLFAMTLGRQTFSKRMIILTILYLAPIAFALLVRYVDFGFRGPRSEYDATACELLVIYGLIPQALLPFSALICSSGLIQDEIEEQTITYLLIRPLPRWSIFVAKLLATMVVTIALTGIFTAITFLVIGWGEPNYWSSGGLVRMLKTIVLFALSLAAYDTFFAFLSLLLKRALLVGIAYIIFLEGVMAFIDFVVRKLTVMYYFRVLCERWIDLSKTWPTPVPWTFTIDMETAPSLSSCLMIVGGAILILTALSGILMESREFRVKTPEGN